MTLYYRCEEIEMLQRSYLINHGLELTKTARVSELAKNEINHIYPLRRRP